MALRNQFKQDFQTEYQIIEISEKIINLATNIAELLVCAVMMRFNVLSLVLISYRPTR